MKAACGAKTRNGTPCRRAPCLNGRCPNHGGKSLAGIASPRLTHGRYSRSLPVQLTARYTAAQHEPELLSLRDELALRDARIADVPSRVDSGESGQLWQQLRGLNAELDTARRTGDTDALAAALSELQATIRQGSADYAAWNDIYTLLDQRRKLSESERRRLVALQQMLSVEQAMLLVARVASIVKAHVTDRATLGAISADLAQLLEHPGSH